MDSIYDMQSVRVYNVVSTFRPVHKIFLDEESFIIQGVP